MISKGRADQISGGVFLIGLALLFMNVLPFFPGILFVLGASAMARGVAEGQEWYSVSGGLFLIGLGIMIQFGISLPILLIVLGLVMLSGYNMRSCSGKSSRRLRLDSDYDYNKPKNDEKWKNDDAYGERDII